MPPSSYVKLYTKEMLRKKWPKVFAIGAILLSVICLLYVILALFNTIFSNFIGVNTAAYTSLIPLAVITQFFAVPLIYGVLRWFWFTVLGENLPLSEIFCYFSGIKEYLKAISLGFRIFCRVLGILAICFLPSIIISVICQPLFYKMLNFSMPYFVSSLWGIGNMLTLFGAILSAILLMRYFAAPILMINNNNLPPQEALHLSIIISKQANGRTLGFILSFMGWGVLSVFVLPLVYTLPYFIACYATYCKFIIDNYNNMAKAQNEAYYPNYQPPTF